jgi:hypothetical protein
MLAGRIVLHMRHGSTLLTLAVLSAAFLTGCGDKAYPVRTYQMGEKVTMGPLIYTVFETQWLTHTGTAPDEKVPQYRFFLVRLSAVNSSGGDVMMPALSVQDDKGTTFPELTSDVGVPQWAGTLRQVHPADSVAGNVVFDCPPGHYKLRIEDDLTGHAALIDIPLTFTSETPEVPTPGESKRTPTRVKNDATYR